MSTAAIKTARRVFEVLEYFDEVKRPPAPPVRGSEL